MTDVQIVISLMISGVVFLVVYVCCVVAFDNSPFEDARHSLAFCAALLTVISLEADFDELADGMGVFVAVILISYQAFAFTLLLLPLLFALLFLRQLWHRVLTILAGRNQERG